MGPVRRAPRAAPEQHRRADAAVPRVLLVDNYDSFTYNLVQALQMLGADVRVFRNDRTTVREIEELAPTHVVVSPGPGRPERAGVSMRVIEAFAGRIPVLGVCLGHQALAAVYGAEIVGARELMHGKRSAIDHDGRGLFEGVETPLVVGRYHSLAVRAELVPDELAVTARAEDGEIMGLRHREHAVSGVQFHPESILTPHGPRLLASFLRQAGQAS